jgi:hypothetical protein
VTAIAGKEAGDRLAFTLVISSSTAGEAARGAAVCLAGLAVFHIWCQICSAIPLY